MDNKTEIRCGILSIPVQTELKLDALPCLCISLSGGKAAFGPTESASLATW